MRKLFFILWLLFLSCIFWQPGVNKVDFYHFWAHFGNFGWLPYWNGKKWIKLKSCASSIPIWNVNSVFFSFSVRKGFKMTKTYQKISHFHEHATFENMAKSWDDTSRGKNIFFCISRRNKKFFFQKNRFLKKNFIENFAKSLGSHRLTPRLGNFFCISRQITKCYTRNSGFWNFANFWVFSTLL